MVRVTQSVRVVIIGMIADLLITPTSEVLSTALSLASWN